MRNLQEHDHSMMGPTSVLPHHTSRPIVECSHPRIHSRKRFSKTKKLKAYTRSSFWTRYQQGTQEGWFQKEQTRDNSELYRDLQSHAWTTPRTMAQRYQHQSSVSCLKDDQQCPPTMIISCPFAIANNCTVLRGILRSFDLPTDPNALPTIDTPSTTTTVKPTFVTPPQQDLIAESDS